MNGNDLTPEILKQQHAESVAKGDTFETHGITVQDAKAYLNTDEGALYWWRVAEASPGLSSTMVDNRAIGQLMSGRELPRMETIEPGEPLLKFVAEGSSPTAHSPYWMRESQANAAIAEGRNISDYFGLPVGSEAPRYGMYRITPEVPTQVFINTVAPTSELGGLITKSGGAEQVLVPNRQLFKDSVYIKAVDNTPSITTEVEHGAMPPGMVRGATVLGAAAVLYDATTTASRTSDLLRQGNTVGAQSDVLHFGGRNLGALGGAALGAEALGTAGAETGPLDLVIGGVGAIGGAIAGDKLANACDHHRIYNQSDAQGVTWSYDPTRPQQGWTLDIPPLPDTPHGQHFTAPPAVAEALTYQASNTAVELALAHPTTPRDSYTQPASANDTLSKLPAPWTRDAQTRQWSRHVTDQVLEHGLTGTHDEVASPQRAAQLDAAAQQTIAANLAHSPLGMAERYQMVYEQRGWQQYGPIPDAVTNALKTPAHTLEASDGHTYTHSQDGQWQTPGALWGTNVADGRARAELDATERAAASAASQMIPQLATNDPRHPNSPDHRLYNELHRLVPDASDNRLLQFTAACHEHKITADNLGFIHMNEERMTMTFYGASALATPTSVDLSTPSPQPAQSIQQIQRYDQQQAQMMGQIHAQNAQLEQQQPQGPVPGGPQGPMR